MNSVIKETARFIAHFTQRVPLVLQFEIVECGAACLSMILRKHGLYVGLPELRVRCGVSRDGSNMLNIKRAAMSYGLNVRAYQPTIDELGRLAKKSPLICWWNFNHFVVLDKAFLDSFYISDPAGGRYTLSRETFAKSFSGLALAFAPSSDFKQSGRAENPLRLFIPYLYDYRYSLLFLIGIALASLIPSLASPALSGVFVNDFLQDKRYNLGIPIIWFSLFIALLSTALSLVELKVVRRMSLQIQRRLTLQIALKLFTVDFSFYSTRYLGDIASRLGLSSSISSILIHRMLPIIFGLAGAVLILPFIVLISWQLSVASLIYVVITTFLSFIYVNLVLDSSRSIEVENGKLSGLNTRIFSDTKTIKSSGLERSYLARYQELFAPILDKQQSIQFTSSIFGWMSTLVQSTYAYGSIALSGYLVMKGEINLAGFMAFQALRSQVVSPLLGISSFLNTYQTATAELCRIDDLSSCKNDPRVSSLKDLDKSFSLPSLSGAHSAEKDDLSARCVDPHHNEAMPRKEIHTYSGSLNIVNLSLSFSPLTPPVLCDINLPVRPGEMVTLVGASGSGKSTLVKTIVGLYTQTQGDIFYDNHKWQSFSDEVLNHNIGYVSQESAAFNGSLKNNITLFNPEYTESDIRDAVKLACLGDFVKSYPNSLDGTIRDYGSSLSGGQLQRLEIARAIIKKPTLLCLDEATSSLDIPTERQIIANLRRTQMTLVCVAHRLFSAKMSDLVVVMEKGTIVEVGKPKQLLNDHASHFYKLDQAEKYGDMQ